MTEPTRSTFSRGTSLVNLDTYSVAGLSTMSSGLPICSMLPLNMIAIRSASLSASSKSWVMKTMVFFSRD